MCNDSPSKLLRSIKRMTKFAERMQFKSTQVLSKQILPHISIVPCPKLLSLSEPVITSISPERRNLSISVPVQSEVSPYPHFGLVCGPNCFFVSRVFRIISDFKPTMADSCNWEIDENCGQPWTGWHARCPAWGCTRTGSRCTRTEPRSPRWWRGVYLSHATCWKISFSISICG